MPASVRSSTRYYGTLLFVSRHEMNETTEIWPSLVEWNRRDLSRLTQWQTRRCIPR